MNLIGGLAGHAGPQSVQGPDPIGIPLALDQTRHLELEFGYEVAAGFPLVASSLAAVHVVATDPRTAVVLGRLPGEKDAAGRLVPPAKVLWGVRDG